MTEPIRILIADDHTIVRTGVRMILEAETDFAVVGEALDGQQALEMVESLHPDLVLMDIAMPVMNGLEATRQIKARFPEVNILVLTMHRSDEYFFEMLKAGAAGYVLKTSNMDELVLAVRAASQGDVFLSPNMANRLLRDYLSRLGDENEPAASLSGREREIMLLLAEGYSTKEIADKLVISSSTVHTHRNNLMKKLNLTSRYELIQYARKHGWITGS